MGAGRAGEPTLEVREGFKVWIEPLTLSVAPFRIEPREAVAVVGPPETRPDLLLAFLSGSLTPDGEDSQSIRPMLAGALAHPRDLPVFLDGDPLFGKTRVRQIGTLIGDPDRSILGRTVLEEFLGALAAADASIPEQQVAIPLLRPYDLSEFTGRSTSVLSGGEKQRLVCAGAMAGSRRLFLGDFSTSSLDRSFSNRFLNAIARFVESGGAVALAGLRPSEYERLGCRRALQLERTTVNGSLEAVVSAVPLKTVKQTNLRHRRRRLSNALNRRVLGETVLRVEEARLRNLTQPATFEVKQGEIVVLTGANGAGKSTLARLIVDAREARRRVRVFKRLSFERELAGAIEFPDEISPTLAPQNPDYSVFGVSLRDELPDPELRKLCGFTPADDDLDPRAFCAGSKKLIATASALSMARGLAVLDEPSLGMDLSRMLRLVALLNRFDDIAILIITHDPALVDLGRSVRLGQVGT